MTGVASDLAEAADANFVVHASWLAGRLPGMTVVAPGDLVLVDSGLPCDTFNVVCRARLDPASARGRIAAALAHFRAARRPFSWWVSPADEPAALGELLQAAGLAPAEAELAMAADLAGLGAAGPGPAGLHVMAARSRRDVQAFAEVNAANWTPPDSQVLRFYDLAADALCTAGAPLRLYVGYLDGQPVATAEVTAGGGVVGVYNVATRAAWRRRGIAGALLRVALRGARSAGARTAVLQAAPDGVGVYERLGFQAFGRVTEYKPQE